MHRQAMIIGGGVAGLAAAAALGRDGWQVTVRERDGAPATAGTALGIWPAALHALDALGAGDEVRRAGVPQLAGRFLRPDGSRIAEIDVGRLHRRTGDHVHLLSRPPLLAILQEAAIAAGARIQRGDPVDGPEAGGADLLVVADGVFSRTRERLFGPAYRARYSGGTAWRGVVPDMPVDAFAEVWGRGVKFGVTPQEGGRTNWFATTAAPEGSFHPGAEVAVLRRTFGTWAAPVAPVLDAIEESGVLRHDVYVTPPLPSYVSGAAVLIGDAAHAMSPDLGRGACEAIIDAVTLARCLRGASAQAEGLQGYDRSRRRVTRRLSRVAAAAAGMTRVRRGLPFRDGLLRVGMLAGPPA
ncbi:FAD-dependent monooxygenase [Actinoplanes sp. NBRC 101535]|uniref:FAD-dependent monooxygenase n=1 Tax=Actinoplanes sp. NBRC 101535 TaxID=3032196 RepID=UPI0025564F9D|nr:FAD-dependent monooxygenase [Actinoplanes sp. NBRC 101535]